MRVYRGPAMQCSGTDESAVAPVCVCVCVLCVCVLLAKAVVTELCGTYILVLLSKKTLMDLPIQWLER